MFEGISTFQWETFFQLVSVALIMLAGPIIIFILAARGGNM
ncbi:photosystem II protein [Gloeocapsopsis sp. AAB1 = 1H9]|uniref:Photosystem II reaction center protein Psb30 n=1 Tax=Gloeocapsopsis dulcis AAB1 = 1H9 TaxID=1433147 RepID=A0A6N8FW76_9CHRO|nr:photosystem II protein [Gloeocapsopsis dulcis AAB1 = 1H9]PIG91061.1 photosystem II reaction center protein Ycf12 [Gloeocapsopsis sp. IPPAS B-1203]